MLDLMLKKKNQGLRLKANLEYLKEVTDICEKQCICRLWLLSDIQKGIKKYL